MSNSVNTIKYPKNNPTTQHPQTPSYQNAAPIAIISWSDPRQRQLCSEMLSDVIKKQTITIPL
jgi:hypothetical protein